MAAQGVNVKALNNMPELLDVEMFYYMMYIRCGIDYQNVLSYCDLHELTKDEKIEAIEIVNIINSKV